MKSFSKWTIAEVEEHFSLNFCKSLKTLSQWTDEPLAISSVEENLDGQDYAASSAYDATKNQD
ncbi:hypothetical protein GCAAIG_12095 [Candidatus Electronema halotolerans]